MGRVWGRTRARQDSNLRPRAPEARALSTELRALGRRSLAARTSRARGSCAGRIGREYLGADRVRVAIISDTHLPRGTRSLPEPCVERLRSADAILHCGDVATTG